MDLYRYTKYRSRQKPERLVENYAAPSGLKDDGAVVWIEMYGVRGADRPNTTYGYRLQMTPKELSAIVEKVVGKWGDKPSGKAIGVLIRAAHRRARASRVRVRT